MFTNPHQWIRARMLVLPLFLFGAVLAGWWWFTPSDALDSRPVDAEVVEVLRNETVSHRGATAVLTTARIRLPDGHEARVRVSDADPPELGRKLALIETRHADGSRSYRRRDGRE